MNQFVSARASRILDIILKCGLCEKKTGRSSGGKERKFKKGLQGQCGSSSKRASRTGSGTSNNTARREIGDPVAFGEVTGMNLDLIFLVQTIRPIY